MKEEKKKKLIIRRRYHGIIKYTERRRIVFAVIQRGCPANKTFAINFSVPSVQAEFAKAVDHLGERLINRTLVKRFQNVIQPHELHDRHTRES